ncbi:MAG: L-histidine N(alpha)-methyltransferase [Nocardioidaceae bacterium]|nr:L-histidine N(alpha)-methyltransferase [Nocardioidaceae bacterium]
MTDRRSQMIADVRAGLGSRPFTLPPKYFYDGRGSELFDQITRLPEYYPTRAERSILDEHASSVAKLTEATTLVELGSGTSDKTRLLLDALRAHGTLETFVPLDVDPVVLEQARTALVAEYPGLAVEPQVADFDQSIPTPAGGSRLVAFLGSTIGNYEPVPRAAFLRRIAGALEPGDHLLLGTDLVKDVGRLVAAYDDAAGVTAAFNRNVLAVLAAELDADVDPDLFDHVALWNADDERIEMRLRSRTAQVVRVPGADLEVAFEAGEDVRTEVSSKFRREGVERELAAAGLELVHWWTDADDDFGLSLATPAAGAADRAHGRMDT